MKPIIGIIQRKEKLPSKTKIEYVNEEIINCVTKYNAIALGINIKNIEDTKNVIKKLDGIILQGGDNYQKNELELIRYLYNNNIPTLGICLGMQTMALALNGKLKKIKNHIKQNKKKVHEIKIDKKSKIYDIIKKEKTIVNSRHKFAVKKTSFEIVGYSNDKIIEIIEDKTKKFFIGLQWHPESLNNDDTKKIFEYFIEKAGEKI